MKRPSVVLLVTLICGLLAANAIGQNVPYDTTFSIAVLPGEYHYIPLYVVGEARLSGDFVEAQSQLVNFYLLTDQQYATFKSTGILASLFSIANVASAAYDAPIPSPGNYYLIITHGSGYDNSSEKITLHLRLDGTNPFYLALDGLGPVSIVGLIVYFVLVRRDNRKQILSLLKKNPNYGIGKDEDDEKILTVTRELCRDLRFPFDPVTVYYYVWLKFGGIRLAPSDHCLFAVKGLRRGWLQLPAVLRGKLNPSEWKPLIASSLIYAFNPSFRRKRRFGILLFPMVVIALGLVDIVVIQLFYAEFSVASSAMERFLLLQFPNLLFSLEGLLFVLAARKWNMSLRSNFIQADNISAKTLGSAALLQTLVKIDSMALPDLEQGKREKSTIWTTTGSLPWPSINQRIERLQGVS